jgi:hypothetical protein
MALQPLFLKAEASLFPWPATRCVFDEEHPYRAFNPHLKTSVLIQ